MVVVVGVDVGVVCGLLVTVDVNVVVSVDVWVVEGEVVGVVTSHAWNPPASNASAIAFNEAAISAQPDAA